MRTATCSLPKCRPTTWSSSAGCGLFCASVRSPSTFEVWKVPDDTQSTPTVRSRLVEHRVSSPPTRLAPHPSSPLSLDRPKISGSPLLSTSPSLLVNTSVELAREAIANTTSNASARYIAPSGSGRLIGRLASVTRGIYREDRRSAFAMRRSSLSCMLDFCNSRRRRRLFDGGPPLVSRCMARWKRFMRRSRRQKHC